MFSLKSFSFFIFVLFFLDYDGDVFSHISCFYLLIFHSNSQKRALIQMHPRYLLSAFGLVLLFVCCLLFVVYCLLFVVCCLLFVVCCLLFVCCFDVIVFGISVILTLIHFLDTLDYYSRTYWLDFGEGKRFSLPSLLPSFLPSFLLSFLLVHNLFPS